MRILIHGIKSILRRPTKTTMLFLILFVVFNLIFIGFIIQNSISESKEFIRQEIGSAVEYKMDYTSLLSGAASNPRQGMQRITTLSLQVANKMAQSPYVTQYFITGTGNVNSDNISPAETQEATGGFQRSFSDFTLKGSNVAEHLDFIMDNIMLKEGTTFSTDNIDNGDNVILISDAVASTNDLRIHDIVSLSQANGNLQRGGEAATTSESVPQDFEIIGIYEVKNTEFNVNTILTSNNVIDNLSGNTASDDTSATIVYMLDNPDHVSAFIEENTPYLTSEYHTLYSNDDEYESLTKPLDMISMIASILFVVVFAAGVTIILAIVSIFVRDRKFEIGLLLSSGEGRLKIIGQFVFEIMAIAMVAFILSVGTSNLASKVVGDWIVENQLLAEDSVVNNTGADTGINQNRMGRAGGSNQTTSIYGEVDMQNVADEFDASVSMQVINKLLLASMLLVLAGSTVPLIVIMRYNPRRILQDN